MRSKISRPDNGRLRYALLGILFLAGLAVLAFRLHTVQVRDTEVYLGAQDETSFRRVRLPATRGRILDRNGTVLADNRARYCVAFYLDELRASGRWSNTVNRIDGQIDEVGRILGLPREVTRDGIWQHLRRRRPIPLVAFRDLDERSVARLAEWPEPLPGVDLLVQQDRVYPYGDLACHIIGYVGKGNPAESAPEETEGPGEEGADDFDFFLPDLTGRDGIEKSFDATLAGHGGGELVRIDAVGYRHETQVAREPVPGKDVSLTIDVSLQQLAERALDGHRGAVVLLDARNGDILAMASAPRYSLSDFVPSLKADVWNRLLHDPARPLYHRAAQGVYPPGSVMKPAVAQAALAAGVIGSSTIVDCPGYYDIGQRRIRCASRWGHGEVSVGHALAVSCNPFFIDCGLKLGWDPGLRDTYEALGFGTAPQIGIQTASGLLPTSDWKKRRMGDGWRDGDTGNISIGQGFLIASPLQVGMLCLALANDGELVAPRLVRDAGDGEGPRTNRISVGSMGWSPRACAIVRGGMVDAIHSPAGTGRRAALPGLRAAGKTGTAEYYEDHAKKKHAWMISYAPADDPRYALAVVCEDSDSGGHSAAAVVRPILAGLFGIRDVPEESEAPEAPVPPVSESADPFGMGAWTGGEEETR